MRIAVTRPQLEAERTADALRKLGHEVLVAPLMRVEPIAADLTGAWRAVVITSANTPAAVRDNAAIKALPLYAVGHRSADAAKAAGFTDVTSAGGDVRDLVLLVAERRVASPLLYLAGEDRAADLVGELAAHGIEAALRVVYRAVTAPYPDRLVAALQAGEVDAVLHYSRRSAENYVAGGRAAGIVAAALAPRQLCLADTAAAPLVAAGATKVAIARRPDEVSLFELLA
ncbi:MAG: uroporphyrinogen-III synthase [Pseudolabrys sp.]